MVGRGEADAENDGAGGAGAPGFRVEAFPGAALRSAREAMGISIGEVSRHTRIPERHLDAIERADYDLFRAPLYAVGFARTYARHVGLTELWIAEAVRAHYLQERLPERDSIVGAERKAGLSVFSVMLLVLAIGTGLALLAWLVRMWG